MKNIIILIIAVLSGWTCIAQTGYSVNDSTSVGDTVKLLLKDSTELKRQTTGKKKPRALSPTADLRTIDGLFLGLAYRIQGYRAPDSNIQKISAIKSLRTRALVFEYRGEWTSVFKNTDIAVSALADIKGNILNFFGRGNETDFDRTDDFRKYYRVNFSFYQLEPLIRVHLPGKFSISAGPSLQHFVFKPDDNEDRFINNEVIISQFDYLQESKTHAGLVLNFNHDTRNDLRMPSKGVYFNLRLQGYEGLNKFSNAYAQFFPQFAFYKSLNSSGTFVLANRIGAGFSAGEPAFYQSAFLGSQDNLLGYRKFRFAGDHLLYNNLEARLTLTNSFPVLRGKMGVIGFYDTGRVWISGETSKAIHHGYGAGVFLMPRNRFFVRAVAGFSDERLQPTVALRQRF